jgi:hypothetical protein
MRSSAYDLRDPADAAFPEVDEDIRKTLKTAATISAGRILAEGHLKQAQPAVCHPMLDWQVVMLLRSSGSIAGNVA